MEGAEQKAPTPDRQCLVELDLNQTPHFSGGLLEGFAEDAIRIYTGDTTLRNATIIDSFGDRVAYKNKAHRDGVQLIADNDIPRVQYAAGLIDGVLIENCHFRSRGKLQGIFCSDGRNKNIVILGCVIQTRGFHYISLSGLHSGHIEGNVKEDGTPCPVYLWPSRIGGNMDNDPVCVIGYKDPEHRPRPLDEIMPNSHERSFAKDRRTLVKDNPNVTYLTDFDQDGFNEAVAALDAPRDVLAHTKTLKVLAREFGERVYAA